MALNVLFVDDEPMVLNGLRRMLRGYRKEWDMSFANSGQEALELLEQKKYNAIVSDMRMPEMTGNVLLGKVSETHPHCARLILSGHAELSAILDAVKPAHQFHSKPCDVNSLSQALSGIHELNLLGIDEQTQAHMVSVTRLRSTQEACSKLKHYLNGPSKDFEDLYQIIKSDIALTSQVLRLVNSSFFGKAVITLDLRKALQTLGGDLLIRLNEEIEFFTSSETQDEEDYVCKINQCALQFREQLVEAALKKGLSDSHLDEVNSLAALSFVGPLICYGLDMPQDAESKINQSKTMLTLWGFAPEYVQIISRGEAVSDPNLQVIHELLTETHSNFCQTLIH